MARRPSRCKRSDGKPKDRYETREDANGALHAAMRRKPLVHLVVYRCDECTKFHIGAKFDHGKSYRRKQRGSWS